MALSLAQTDAAIGPWWLLPFICFVIMSPEMMGWKQAHT